MRRFTAMRRRRDVTYGRRRPGSYGGGSGASPCDSDPAGHEPSCNSPAATGIVIALSGALMSAVHASASANLLGCSEGDDPKQAHIPPTPSRCFDYEHRGASSAGRSRSGYTGRSCRRPEGPSRPSSSSPRPTCKHSIPRPTCEPNSAEGHARGWLRVRATPVPLGCWRRAPLFGAACGAYVTVPFLIAISPAAFGQSLRGGMREKLFGTIIPGCDVRRLEAASDRLRGSELCLDL